MCCLSWRVCCNSFNLTSKMLANLYLKDTLLMYSSNYCEHAIRDKKLISHNDLLLKIWGMSEICLFNNLFNFTIDDLKISTTKTKQKIRK